MTTRFAINAVGILDRLFCSYMDLEVIGEFNASITSFSQMSSSAAYIQEAIQLVLWLHLLSQKSNQT